VSDDGIRITPPALWLRRFCQPDLTRACQELQEELEALGEPQVALLTERMSASPWVVQLTRSMSLYSSRRLVSHLFKAQPAYCQGICQNPGPA